MNSVREKMTSIYRARSESPGPRPPPNSQTTPGPPPALKRMPSSDTLDRSTHNAIPTNPSGSEQSKDEIIVKLKKANAALTAKAAEMEAAFMNDCSILSSQISQQKEIVKHKDEENAALMAKVKSHESKLKEGIQIISAMESEKVFQKQTITDLKNQLFQLQHEIEDAEYDKSEEVNAHKERSHDAELRLQKLEKERNALLQNVDEVCMERDKLKSIIFKLEKSSDESNPIFEISRKDNKGETDELNGLSSPTNNDGSTSMIRGNWRQLEEKSEKLKATLTKLHETQSSLASLEHKHKAMQKQFDTDLDAQTTGIKMDAQRQVSEMKSMLRARDDTIVNLHQRLENYNDDLTKAEDEVDRLSAQINDSKLNELKKELEEANRLFEDEKKVTSDLTEKINHLTETIEQLEEETRELRVSSVDQILQDKDDKIDNLEHEVNIFRNKLDEDKKQAEMLLNIKASRIRQLEDDLKIATTVPEKRSKQLEKENDDLRKEMESLEKNLTDVMEGQNKMEKEMENERNELLVQLKNCRDNDGSKTFEMSSNSIGVVDEVVVQQLKDKLAEMEEERFELQNKLRRIVAEKDAEISKLQEEVNTQLRNVLATEKAHRAEIVKLMSAGDKTEALAMKLKLVVDEKEDEIKKMKLVVDEKEDEMRRLKNDFENQKGNFESTESREGIKSSEEAWKTEKGKILQERKDLDNQVMELRQDLESREEIWISEKRQILEERKDLDNQVKELRQDLESREDTWKLEKMQIVKERKGLENKLKLAIEETTSQRMTIKELEKECLVVKKTCKELEQDLEQLEPLRINLTRLENEIEIVKEGRLADKKNHQKIVATLKDEGRKRTDKLKIIELTDELEKVRSELRKAKKTQGTPESAKKETVNRAYSMAKDTQHKRDLSSLEEMLNKEIKELKGKLSDRDMTITATLRSSVLQEQKINTLKEQLNDLHDQEYGPGANISSVDTGALDELENLRESAESHHKTERSLSQQIMYLKKQIRDTKLKSSYIGSPSKMEKQIQEYKVKLKERDGAIQTLVKSSITQEQQISALRDELSEVKMENKSKSFAQSSNSSNGGPSWTAFQKLQQESEIFAGQIIEQDEEIEDLKRILHETNADSTNNENFRRMIDDLREQLQEQHQFRDEEKGRSRTMADAVKLELEEERNKRDELQVELEKLRSKNENPATNGTRLTRIHEELEQVEEANQKLQFEVRDLRRKLRSAQIDAERVTELESELAENSKYIKELKKSRRKSDDVKEQQLQVDLEEALEQRDAMDAEMRIMRRDMRKMEEECQRIEIQCKDLQNIISVCREEKEEVRDEFRVRETEMKKVEDNLRGELSEAVKLRDEIEAKHQIYTENEAHIKAQMESQKTLKEIAISEKEAAYSKSGQEIVALQMKIKELQNDYDDQNEIISSFREEVKKLRNTQMQRLDNESTEIISALTTEVKKLRDENMAKDTYEDSSEIVAALTAEVKKLRNNHLDQNANDETEEIIAALTQEIKKLHADLKQKSNGGDIEMTVRAEVEQEIRSMKSQKDFLANENLRLQTALDSLESDRKKIGSLIKQVDEAEKGRTQFEKTMISTYERKLNLVQMNKDLTIDGLRKDLAQSKETFKQIESDLLKKIRSLEVEKHEFEAELKAKMQHKNAKIEFLEQTLAAHEQVAGHMKDELDQLQSGMETVSVTRRAEVEEMQEELVNVQNTARKYEREMNALKMHIEEQKFEYMDEINKLQNHIERLEMEGNESPLIRQAAAERENVYLRGVSEQNDNLKSKINSIQAENRDLRDQVEKTNNSRSSSKNDKWRNSALQEQVIALTKRLRELEGDDSSMRSSSSRRSMKSDSGGGRRLPPGPRVAGKPYTNMRPDTSVNGSMYDEISTHTEQTF